MKSTFLYAATGALLTCLTAGPAVSAGAPATATAAPVTTPQGETLFGEVVVTARKRSESLQDAPVAINAFNKTFLETFRVVNLQDLSNFTPGLLISEANTMGGNHIYLRGIGSQLDSALADGAVSIVVDGVQLQGAIIPAAQFDLGQVEVLRGPQALFFGKNSPGGVISMTTAQPTGELSAGATVGYEFSAQEKYVDGYVSGPITSNLRARLAVHYSEMRGWWNFVTLAVPGFSLPQPYDHGPRQHDTGLRGSVTWEPAGRLEVKAHLTYFDLLDHTQVVIQRLNCTPGADPFILPQYATIEDCTANNTVVTGTNFPQVLAADPATRNEPMGYQANTQYNASITTTYHVTDNLTLTSVTGYYDASISAGSNFGVQPFAIIYSDQIFHVKQFDQELRLASKFGGWFNFLLGGFYEGQHRNYRQGIITNAGPTVTGIGPNNGPLVETTAQSGHAYSGFGQLILTPIRHLEVDAGGRYSYESKSGTFMSNVFPGAAAGVSHDWSNFSPEVTVSYKPEPNLNLYGSFKEGFKSGGIEASAGTPTSVVLGSITGKPFDPVYGQEKARGFEIGAKLTTTDHRLRVNLAAFTYHYTGLQLSSFDPVKVSITIQNIGGANTRGIEGDFSWTPPGLDNLTIYGSGDLLHARYSDFIGDCYAGQSILQGCNLAFDPASGLYKKQSEKGLPMKSAPDFTATIGGNYQFSLTQGWKLALSADADYSSEYSADLADNPFIYQKRFVKINAAIRLSHADDRWQLALIGKNLTDEFVVSEASKDFVANAASVTGGVGGPADYFGNVLRGREVRLEASFKY